MERSTEGEGHFGKEILIPDGAFSPESKYHLRLRNSIPAISRIEFLILHGARRTVHSGTTFVYGIQFRQYQELNSWFYMGPAEPCIPLKLVNGGITGNGEWLPFRHILPLYVNTPVDSYIHYSGEVENMVSHWLQTKLLCGWARSVLSAWVLS